MAILTGRDELAETPADDDWIHVIDKSDTSSNAAGTSKKNQYSNLIPDSTTTVKGRNELATDAETNAGADTTRTMTPSNLKAWTGSGVVPLYAPITVENPTGSEDITMFFTAEAVTITEMRAVLLGSSTPSVTWTIRHHATDRNNAGSEVVTSGTTTTSTTSGSDVTSFNDATIVADSFVWLETTAQSGTVTELHVSLRLTRD